MMSFSLKPWRAYYIHTWWKTDHWIIITEKNLELIVCTCFLRQQNCFLQNGAVSMRPQQAAIEKWKRSDPEMYIEQ